MARIGARIGTVAAAAGGLLTAFLAFSPTAAADPAVPLIPGAPGIDVAQQLANAPAMASQFLQNAANLLSRAATPAAATPAPAPTASASLNLPQSTAPAASAPLNTAVGSVPPGQANLPTSTPMPLLNQLPLPGNMLSVAQSIPGLGANPAPIPSIQAPMTMGPITPGSAPSSLPPSLNPFSALP